MVKLGFHTAIWGRETMEDFRKALDEMSIVGWDGFEYAGGWLERYYDRTDELKALLAAHDMELTTYYCSNAYIDPATAEGEMERAKRKVDFLAEMECSLLLIDGGRKREEENTEEDFHTVVRAANRLGEITRSRGLISVWHQHWGSMFEYKDAFYRLMDHTDPELVYFCPDTAQLALGDFDLVETFTRYLNRIRYVHFKDLDTNRRFIENGRGIVDFPTLWKILKDADYDGWIVVDLDYTSHPPMEASAMCKKYLNQFLGVQSRRDREKHSNHAYT